jgi:hypothetical protein
MGGAKMLTSRRRSKNSGGGIAPAAIAGLIEGAACSVNAFQPLRDPPAGPGKTDKLLMRLNFLCRPARA